MYSYGENCVFHFLALISIVTILQVSTFVNHLPFLCGTANVPFNFNAITDTSSKANLGNNFGNVLKALRFDTIRPCKDIPNRELDMLPTYHKRNLENLAKNGDGYLKIFQNKNSDKKDGLTSFDKIRNAIQHKRGIAALARNRDFPKNKYKPKIGEMPSWNCTYLENGRFTCQI